MAACRAAKILELEAVVVEQRKTGRPGCVENHSVPLKVLKSFEQIRTAVLCFERNSDPVELPTGLLGLEG